MLKGNKGLTLRGFKIFRFADSYNQRCVMQESSLVCDEPHCWLGVEGETMHISKSQARDLADKLLEFAETGEVY